MVHARFGVPSSSDRALLPPRSNCWQPWRQLAAAWLTFVVSAGVYHMPATLLGGVCPNSTQPCSLAEEFPDACSDGSRRSFFSSRVSLQCQPDKRCDGGVCGRASCSALCSCCSHRRSMPRRPHSGCFHSCTRSSAWPIASAALCRSLSSPTTGSIASARPPRSG